MSLTCPVDGTALELVIFDAMLPIETTGHQCVECGGAFLGAAAQKAVLGQGLAVSTDVAGIRPSPKTGKPMYRMEAGGVELDGCADSGAIWFDRGELVLMRRFVQSVRAQQGKDDANDEESLLQSVRAECSDCGDLLDDDHSPVDSPIGIVCSTCPKRLGFEARTPTPGRETFDVEGAHVVVEHGTNSSYSGSVTAELEFDGALNASLRPPGLWGRLKRMWSSAVDIGHPALSERFEIETDDVEALRAFLKNRGPADMILELSRIGAPEIQLQRERFLVSLSDGTHDSVALKLEQTARRLLDVYRAFSCD